LDAPNDSLQTPVDYLFVATGVQREAIENQFSFNMSPIRDDEGNIVAVGNEDLNVFVDGSAAGLARYGFPQAIKNIIEGLGISENTISLWVNGLLAERHGWSWLTKNGPNRQKINNSLQFATAA